MTPQELQKLKDEAQAARAAAKVAADDAAANPNDAAKQQAAADAEKKAIDAEAALAKAEAESGAPAGDAGQTPGTDVLPHAPWWHYVTIGAAMAVVLLGVSQISQCVFRQRAESLTSAYKLAPSNTNSAANSQSAAPDHRVVAACPSASPEDKGAFILRQRARAVEFGDGHRDAAVTFGSYFFANIIILAVFGFISLISLLLITKRGITNAHGTLVAVFLMSSGIGLIYQGMFGVFQQKGNVEDNHRQSVEYGRLVDEIDAYCATGKLAISDPNIVLAKRAEAGAVPESTAVNPAGEGDTAGENSSSKDPKPPTSFFVPVGPDEFILYVEWRTEALKKFSIALDEKPVQSLTDPTRGMGL